MHMVSYLQDIVVLFGAALLVIALSQRLKIPAIVGFLITGIVVGPGGAGLIGDTSHVEVFAELGVVFLLFLIGLELSPKRLRQLGRFFLLGGFSQSIITIATTALLAQLLGFNTQLSLFFGFVLSLGSTAIVLKIYADGRELNSPHGGLSMGILLFQDFLFVPLLIIIPYLAGKGDVSAAAIALRFGGVCLMIGAVFIVSRYLLPHFLRIVVHTKIPELFVIGALFLCLGGALLTEKLGFSMALGAFLAGILISESDYYHQAIAETSPFRDAFNSIFFISIGMLVRMDFVYSNYLEIIGTGLLIILLKTLCGMLAPRLLSFPFKTGFLTAVGLAQTGEFSLVLIREGRALELFDERIYLTSIAASIFTMLATPLLIGAARQWARGIKMPKAAEDSKNINVSKTILPRAIIVGHGLAGRHLSGALKASSIPYTIIELNGRLVHSAKAKGEPIIYGDATRTAILEKAKIESAGIIVFVISDPVALKRGIRTARQMNPNIFIIVRTREMAGIEDLENCGADQVVSEEFETSIEIFTNVLTHLKIPGNVIRAQTALLRDDGYQMMRSAAPLEGISKNLAAALALTAVDNFLIMEEHHGKGKTLSNLDLRKKTGVTVIAVVRDNKPITNPPPDLEIKKDDILVLLGGHAQIDKAFTLLEQGSFLV